MTLFGYGKTTQAIAAKHPDAIFYDDKVNKPVTTEDGHRLMPASMFDPKYSKLEIPSPGIPPSNPLIKQAQHLISEYDFYAPQMPYTIWISGTNGKTTTTQMLAYLLADKKAQSGGNIGTPIANLDPKAPLWILETSSFTLHYTKRATPGIYVLLPITPDHISWHGSIEAYEADKLSPLSRMREGEVVLLPKKYLNTPSSAELIGYESAKELAEYFGIDSDRLKFKGAFLMDALLAMAVDKILFDRIQYQKMDSFEIDPHRQEPIKDGKGRLWINDSKATNIDATVELLKTYSDDQSIHLILGGDDKGVDLKTLFEHLKSYKNLELYLIGANANRLEAEAKRNHIPYFNCGTLKNAIKKIDRLHTTTSVAMLSPAAASLDQFRSYTERGEKFRENIQKLS